MAIFLSKEPQFVLQILSGRGFVCFRCIFTVALTWESLKPPASPVNYARAEKQGERASMVLVDQTQSQIESSFQSQTLAAP